jgi:hypothetical protein
LLPLERLDDVFVGACAENRRAIDIVTPSRCDDDLRGLDVFTNGSADLEAGQIRQQEIAHYQLRLMLARQLNPGLAIIRLQHIPTIPGEKPRPVFTIFHIIIDKQGGWHWAGLLHGGNLKTKRVFRLRLANALVWIDLAPNRAGLNARH